MENIKLNKGKVMKIKKLILETIGSCNLECIMCPTIHYTDDKFLMKDEVFNKVLENIKYNEITYVDMTGWGEPFLDKSLEQRINKIKEIDSKIIVVVTTNATLFNQDRIDVIAKSGLDHINVSFDGGTKEVYESIRIHANYEDVVEKLKNLSNHPDRKYGLSSTCVIMKNNFHDMENYVKLFEDLGFDLVTFKPLDVVSSKKDLSYIIDKEKIYNEYKRLKLLYQDRINIRQSNLSDNTLEGDCYANVAGGTVFINCNGDITPCCNLGHHVPSLREKLFYTKVKKDNFFRFGSIKDKTFKDIEKSPLYREFTEAFYKNMLPTVCEGCTLVSDKIQKNLVSMRNNEI